MTEEVKLTPVQKRAGIDRAAENIALLSGAGCGKTLVLGRRFTELLMRHPDADDPLSHFVALTFTEKAALEMSQRVRRLLYGLAERSKGNDKRRFHEWVQQLSEARISTIHSFCASLLRTHAVEAGIDPEFTICSDELVTDQMLAEAVDEAILRAVSEGREGLAEVIERVGYDRVCEYVRKLTELRTRWDRADYEDPDATLKRWDKLRKIERTNAWEHLSGDERFRSRLREAARTSCEDRTDKLEIYRAQQLSIIRELLDDPGARTSQKFSLLTPKPGNIGSRKAWGGKEIILEVRDRIRSLVAEVAELGIFEEQLDQLDAETARSLSVMTGLAIDADALYASRKRDRGLLDFTDLLTTAARILKDTPRVRESLSDQIKQLLLDEGQDTDSFQIALLETLLFGCAGKLQLPQGRLFVVGDVKQSIYRFRGADVNAFRDLCKRLGAKHREKLTTSFRTHSSGVEFVNHLFAPLMGRDYEAIEAHRKTTPPHPSVEILLAGGPEGAIETARDAATAQGRLTAQRIEEMVSNSEKLVWDEERDRWRAVRYGDIAVLFARMTNTITYERQLAERNIPYYVLGGTGFFRQQEVYDVLNALSVIDNPYDDVSFFGFLRSGMVALDDNALLRIAEAMDPPYLPRLLEQVDEAHSGDAALAISSALPEDASDALQFAVRLLSRLNRRKDAVTIDALIDDLLVETGYEATLLSQFQGHRLVGNVRYLSQRGAAGSKEGMKLADFIEQMSAHVLRQSRHEQASVTGEGEDVVRLMTIHKAKGLEFPVVIIPDLNAGSRGNTDALLLSPAWGAILKYQTDTDGGDETRETPLSYRLAKAREDRDERSEDLRKLYVAVTRHRDHLILIGADWRTKSGQFSSPRSFLSQIDEVLGISQAIETGSETLPYGQNARTARVRRIVPSPPKKRPRYASKPAELLKTATDGTELTECIRRHARDTSFPPLLGPLDPSVGEVEIAITALCDFQYCPMLHRWRYELRTPPIRDVAPGSEGATGQSFDPATLGTLYHRSLELLDFENPQPPEALAVRAIGELDLEEWISVHDFARDLQSALERFRTHELFTEITSSKEQYRELDFQMRVGSAILRGQIDLLYADREGIWRIVDYKSDAISALEVPEHSRRYHLQMLSYAAALEKHLGEIPRTATLYYLKPGETHEIAIHQRTLSDCEQHVSALIERLIRARRTGEFAPPKPCPSETCPYHSLCRKVSPSP